MKTEWVAPPAFDDLYEEYRDAVFHFAFHLTRNRGDAEELFQEAWLRIVQKLPERINPASLKSWIFTVVVNLHRDILRKKRLRRPFTHAAPLEPWQKDGRGSGRAGPPHGLRRDETGQADMGRDIEQALRCLPERQRRIFMLKEIAGFQQAEISDILGLPLGTVKSLMHRAVKRLRGELSAYSPKKERFKCDVRTLSV